jgi:hypothetical protein
MVGCDVLVCVWFDWKLVFCSLFSSLPKKEMSSPVARLAEAGPGVSSESRQVMDWFCSRLFVLTCSQFAAGKTAPKHPGKAIMAGGLSGMMFVLVVCVWFCDGRSFWQRNLVHDANRVCQDATSGLYSGV